MKKQGLRHLPALLLAEWLLKSRRGFKKPNGQTVISHKMVESFMADLKLSKIPGIGPVTMKKLETKGLRKCSDITALSESERKGPAWKKPPMVLS